MIECEGKCVPYSLKIVPSNSSGIIACGYRGIGINLNGVHYRNYVLARVPVPLASHGDELGLVALDATLFAQLANARVLWIFTIVDEATREGVAPLEGRTASRDQQDVKLRFA